MLSVITFTHAGWILTRSGKIESMHQLPNMICGPQPDGNKITSEQLNKPGHRLILMALEHESGAEHQLPNRKPDQNTGIPEPRQL
jgi:hypothetical protein